MHSVKEELAALTRMVLRALKLAADNPTAREAIRLAARETARELRARGWN